MLTSTVINLQCVTVQIFQNVELTKMFLYHFLKANEISVDFGEVLNTGQVSYICARKVPFLFKIYLLIWCRIGKIWAKRTSELHFQWCELQAPCHIHGKVLSNIFKWTKRDKQTNMFWSELIWNKHFGKNLPVLGLAMQASHNLKMYACWD